MNLNKNVDLSNEGLLTDLTYSNAIGCGLPPVCSEKKLVTTTERQCKTVFGKQVCVNVPKVKTVVNQDCIDKNKAHQECVAKEGKFGQNIIKDLKQGSQNIKEHAQDARNTVRNSAKKVVKKLKEKAGVVGKKFRNVLRGAVRKDIIFKLKNNIHGLSTRLYPAIGSPESIKQRKYKQSSVPEAMSAYAQLLVKWKTLGGSESELKNAINTGSNKKFLRLPYNSFYGNNSGELYRYFNATGDPVQLLPVKNIEDAELIDTSQAVENEETGEMEVVDQEEKVGVIRSFFRWLLNLFHRGKDSNPFEEGSGEYNQYNAESVGDAANEPDLGEGINDNLNELYRNGDADGAGSSSDTIMGIPSTYFYIGAAAIVIIGGIIGYNIIKGKTNVNTTIKTA